MKRFFLYAMAALYIVAGCNHFLHTATYVSIMPHWLPAKNKLVLISGMCEIICGVLLLFAKTRRLGAWLTIALLIAVFPANVQMMLDFCHRQNPNLWIAVVRLPLQILLIYWAYIYTKNNKQSPVMNSKFKNKNSKEYN